MDHVIDMAKNNAVFYLEGKKISSDKAIEVLKKNKSLNIQTKDSNSKQPKVYISKKPIIINQKQPSNKTGSIDLETGNIEINGQVHFYATKDGVTSYFNQYGEQVDEHGKRVTNTSGKNPIFYYNGNLISANKAHHLLKTNRNIVVTNETYNNDTYAIILSDSKTNNKNVNINANVNTNRNINGNANVNPNAFIDLTDITNKGAKFYLDSKEISAKKAQEIVNTDKTVHVQTINNKNSYPVVLISMNPVINNKKGLPKANRDNIIDQVKIMRRHNANFYINTKKISYAKALRYVRDNRDAHMTTSMEPPTVIIRTK